MNRHGLPPIIYEGSVKNIRHDLEEPFLFFEFTDRYSIYDWGEMPDAIEGKGANMCRFSDKIYALLEKAETWRDWQIDESKINPSLLNELRENGLKTHRIPEEESLSHIWKVKRIYIPPIVDKDYSFYQKKPKTTLVPLEVVFRFGCPKGSSFPKRAMKDEGYLKSLGLNEVPKEGEKFEEAIIEFSTKLEKIDTYLTLKKAKEISAMSDEEMARLKDLTQLIAYRLKDLFSKMDLELWDGKFEFAFLEGEKNRNFMLVDTIAPDEIRLMYKDMPLSKEILRQAYWRSQWYERIEDYKKEFGEKWKEKMVEDGLRPVKLPLSYKSLVENLYSFLVDGLSKPEIAKQKWQDLYDLYLKELK